MQTTGNTITKGETSLSWDPDQWSTDHGPVWGSTDWSSGKATLLSCLSYCTQAVRPFRLLPALSQAVALGLLQGSTQDNTRDGSIALTGDRAVEKQAGCSKYWATAGLERTGILQERAAACCSAPWVTGTVPAVRPLCTPSCEQGGQVLVPQPPWQQPSCAGAVLQAGKAGRALGTARCQGQKAAATKMTPCSVSRADSSTETGNCSLVAAESFRHLPYTLVPWVTALQKTSATGMVFTS